MPPTGTRWAALAAMVLLLSACRTGAQVPNDPWTTMDSILARITPPRFPVRDLPVTAFGAKGDGIRDCSAAFQAAVEECAKAGGGRVVVPPGEFLTGPIHLLSNVNLYLAAGAILRFQRDPRRYLPPVLTRWEGVECMNYSPLIYAYDQENIAVTGEGTLDGGAGPDSWWPWKGSREQGWKEGMPNQLESRQRLFAMGEQGVPVPERVMGEGSYLRPNFIQPYKCRNILIEGITIVNSPMWEIHPVLCENVTVRRVNINTHGPNNDGCNPESSRDVLIEDCTFDTGDDCIAIKSGRNNDGRRIGVPSENIVIRRCMFKDGHGGITIGSEVSGGARNVFAEQCRMESPILYSALRIKSNAVRGGTIENVFLRDVTVGLVDRAVVDIDLFYEEGRNGNFLPTIRNISIERMTVERCKTALNLVGYEDAPVRNVRLTDCAFKQVSGGYKIEHVDGLQLQNTTINGKLLTR
jgi:polygalacturonase